MRKLILFLAAVAFLLAACRGNTPTPTTALPQSVSLDGLSVETYPVVDGSTSAWPLQQKVACHIFDLTCTWQEGIFFDTTLNLLPEIEEGIDEEAALYIYNHISHSGTHSSYMNLIEGEADLILVARPPSQDELDAARRSAVTLDYRPVALDAFVFLVNVANPVEDFEVEQIRQIYTGAITDWRQLGVDLSVEGNSAINPYRRNPNSGSQELMETLVMQGGQMVEAPELLHYEMIGPFNAIGYDPLGIGYSVFYYATYMLPTETVRLASVGGVLPTSETIGDGSYPFVTEVYVAIRGDALPDSTTVQLRNWLLTAEGQAVVAESGYVPVDN